MLCVTPSREKQIVVKFADQGVIVLKPTKYTLQSVHTDSQNGGFE